MIKVTFEVEMVVDPEATVEMWKDCDLRDYLLNADYGSAIRDQIEYLAEMINNSGRIQVTFAKASNIQIRDSRIEELLAQQKELEAML